jgi:hypothetical protein
MEPQQPHVERPQDSPTDSPADAPVVSPAEVTPVQSGVTQSPDQPSEDVSVERDTTVTEHVETSTTQDGEKYDGGEIPAAPASTPPHEQESDSN